MTNQLTREEILKAKRIAIAAWNKGVRYYDDKHKTYNPAWRQESILEHVSDLLGQHGVEYLASPDDDGSGRECGMDGIAYVNTGDTYNTTLCYDYKTRRFVVSCWGDYAESKRFQTDGDL